MPNLDLVRLQFTRTRVIVDQPLIGAGVGVGVGAEDGQSWRSCWLVSGD